MTTCVGWKSPHQLLEQHAHAVMVQSRRLEDAVVMFMQPLPLCEARPRLFTTDRNRGSCCIV
jgi:hypothetical protein